MIIEIYATFFDNIYIHSDIDFEIHETHFLFLFFRKVYNSMTYVYELFKKQNNALIIFTLYIEHNVFHYYIASSRFKLFYLHCG